MSQSDERVPQRVFDIIQESRIEGHDNVTMLVLANRIHELEQQIRGMMDMSKNILESHPSTAAESRMTYDFFIKHHGGY